MFAPDGYAVMVEVDRKLREWSREAFPYPGSRFDPKIKEERADLQFELRTQFFRNCPSLSIVSPIGQVLRISHEICIYGNEDQNDPTFRGYVFLDEATWTIWPGHASERVRAAADQFVNLSATLEQARQLGAKDDPEIADLARRCGWLYLIANLSTKALSFRQFEGWALTCLQQDVPVSIDSLDPDAVNAAAPLGEGRGGRPRKQEELLRAYRRIFSGGHGSLTLKEVILTIEEETGLSASVKTLDRALRQKPETELTIPKTETRRRF